MKATPPRKYSSCQTSTAATTHSAKPVSEIAFGVRRDSISRSRISVWYSRAVELIYGGDAIRRAPRRPAGSAARREVGGEQRQPRAAEPAAALADPDPVGGAGEQHRPVRRRVHPHAHGAPRSGAAGGPRDRLPDPARAGVAAHAPAHRRPVARGVADEVAAQHVARVRGGSAGERAAPPEPAEPVARAGPGEEGDDPTLDPVEPGAVRRGLGGLPRENDAAAGDGTAREQRCTHSDTSDGFPSRRAPVAAADSFRARAPPRSRDPSRARTIATSAAGVQRRRP